MADPGKYLRIPMHQGLLESQESSKVPLGFMTELVNWVPEQTGGLRARGKWLKGSEGGLPATRQNRGIGTFNRFTDPVIVQTVSAVSSTTNGNPATPSFTWAVPTTQGNMLIAFISMSRSNTAGTSTTVVASGWTSRNTITGTTQQQAGMLELLTTSSFSGAITPFTFSNDGTATCKWEAWILEVQGLSSFDALTTATATSTSVSATSAATTQTSEAVFAFDSARRVASVTAFTLSTATANWTEHAEAGQTATPDYQDAALYVGTRRATGTQNITVTSTVSVNHVLLLATYKGWNALDTPQDSGKQLLAANYDGTTNDIWSVPREELATGTWTSIDPDLPSAVGEQVAFVMGMGAAFYTAPSFTLVRRYDGVSALPVAGSPVGGRSIAINHDRLWIGGTHGFPSRLFYSQLLEPQTWTGSGSSYWDIGTDDGEFIEDITPFNGGLLIGKENSLWFLSGDTTLTFARNQLPAGGAAPGRSLLTTPFGAVIAGTDMVWLYDGETVTRLGNAIEVSYGIEGYCTSSYQDGSIYIADPTAGRVYAFNLGGPVGTWRVEECEDEIGTLYNVGGRQFMGPYSTTVGSLVNYRDFPAPARGKDYDPLGMSYRMRTGDLWVDGALHPSTPRQMYLQLRQRGGDPADPGLVVTPVFNGVDANNCDVGADTPGTRRVKVQGFPQKHRVGSFGFGITQTLAAGDASVFDIEDAWVEYIQESTL